MKSDKSKKLGIVYVMLSFALLLLTVMPAAAADVAMTNAVWMPLDAAGLEAAPQLHVEATQAQGLKLDVILPGFRMGDVVHQGKNWHRIAFDDQSFFDRIGAPNVPVLRYMIGVPKGAQIKVAVTEVDYEEYLDISLEPAQRAMVETESIADLEFVVDDTIYGADKFFPDSWAEATSSGAFHGVPLGALEIFPVRYNPFSGVVRIARQMTVSVEFVGGTDMVRSAGLSRHLRNTLKSMLLNFDNLDFPTAIFMENDAVTDYLILSDSNLVNAGSLDALAQYHRSKGLDVKVVDVATIGSTANEIKAFIQAEYDSVSPPELDYVLLVADINVIPHKTTDGYESDIWYAWLDGNDKIGDVGLGRFPSKTESDLDNMITKALNFHQNIADGPWRDKTVLVAHEEDYPGKYTECKETIASHEYVLPAPSMDRKYGGDKQANWRNADVIESINDGRVVVNYRGHGSYYSWQPWNIANEAFTVNNAGQLNNGLKTPVVFSIACNNAQLSRSAKTLAEAFMVQNQGAVAFLGATDLSTTTVNHTFDKALYFGTWDNGIETIGELLNYANAQAYNVHKSTAEKNMTIYLWLGDPAINIRAVASGNQPPAVPTGLSATAGNGSVALDWSDNSEPDLYGYIVYRATVAGGPHDQIASVSDSVYTDNDVVNGTTYYYVVTAVDQDSLESDPSTEVSAAPKLPDLTPPLPDPMTWTSMPTANDSFSISMTATMATDESGVEYYFEALSVGGHDSGWQDGTTYSDTGLQPSTEYAYHVRARDKSPDQNATGWSIAASAITPGDIIPPDAPTGLTAMAGNGIVDLNWKFNMEPDLAGYDIKRSTTPGGPYSVVATVSMSSYTDTNVINGTTYYYVVIAFDNALNESSDSTEVSATPLAEKLLEQCSTGGDKMDIKEGQCGSQSFRYGVNGDPDYQITKIVLNLSREQDAPDGDFEFSIGTEVNAGVITGSAVNISASRITDTSGGSTFMTYEVEFASPVGPLSAGATYYLNFENNAPNGKTYYLEFAGDDYYANGTYFKEFSNEQKDAWFQIWGGGIQAPPAPSRTISFDGFESNNFTGGEGWLDRWDNQGRVVRVKMNPYEGTYYVKIMGGPTPGYLERAVDLSNFSSARLQFAGRVRSFEKQDKAYVKVSTDGVNYTVVAEFTPQDSDNLWHLHDIDLSAFEMSADFRIVFEGAMSRRINDKWYLDNIEIIGQP